VSEEDLQRAIDVSLATASPLARRIYANERWSAARVQRFVNRVMGATVATSGWRQAARRGGACSMSGRNGVLRGLPRLAAARQPGAACGHRDDRCRSRSRPHHPRRRWTRRNCERGPKH